MRGWTFEELDQGNKDLLGGRVDLQETKLLQMKWGWVGIEPINQNRCQRTRVGVLNQETRSVEKIGLKAKSTTY